MTVAPSKVIQAVPLGLGRPIYVKTGWTFLMFSYEDNAKGLLCQ